MITRAGLTLFVITLAAAAPRTTTLRPMTPDDLFKLEEIGDTAISPDGRQLAYVHRRPLAAHKEFQRGFLGGNDRGDVWLADVGAGRPKNLTTGATDGSGFWMPVWSPDGSRLAMLSTKGGGVRLWVWHKASNRLERWSPRAINTIAAPPFVWLDDTRIAAVLLPEGEEPLTMTVERRAATVAMREWPKTWAGQETTASVLDSGTPAALDKRPQTQLAILNGREAQVVATAFSLRDIRLSPDRKEFTFLSQVAMLQPAPDRLLQHGGANRFGSEDRYELVRLNAAGRDAGPRTTGTHIIPSSVRWSPDGGSASFIGARPGEDRFTVFRATRNAAAQPVTLSGLDPKNTAWTSSGQLLVSAEREYFENGKRRTRTDWFAVSDGAAPRNLTKDMKAPPGELTAEQGARTFVGLAEGDLWRIDPTAATATNLTATFDPKVTSIVWPTAGVTNTSGLDRMILGVQNKLVVDLYRFDLQRAAATPVARPSDAATLVAYRPEGDVGVFAANEPTGTFLTIQRGEARQALVSTNEFLRDIAEGALKQIEYRSTDGQDLKGWVVLPPDYSEGKRYPVVSWVYAGSMARDTPTILARTNISHGLNLQLLAARGYVVLLPSMPLAPEREPSDPYMELPKGVLPALDKLVDMGIADPKRLGVMGQSYGGYSTYGLITQTNRFKAAVSLAGLNDLVSLYGIFDMRSRYEPQAHERLFSQSIAESGQIRMGNPPWKDAGRYLRNSPLFYVDRVETPLLIVQGDMDYVALQQGEQFFTALYRQAKRARFVRYWGEGHVFSSPANIRDMWKQIYAWFDEFLAAPTTTSASTR